MYLGEDGGAIHDTARYDGHDLRFSTAYSPLDTPSTLRPDPTLLKQAS